jgi:vitamin B12 transporter
MSWKFTVIGTIVLGIFLTPDARAQSSPTTKDQGDEEPVSGQTPSELPTVDVTVTVNARPLDSIAEDVTTIGRATIEASGAQTLADLLRYVAGVNVIGPGARATLSTAQIRGGDPNFSVVLLDGVPLNDATDPLGGAVNLELLPLAGVERVEIARGPGSFYHGSAALAGVINVITRRGRREAPDGRLELEAGSASRRRVAGSLAGGFRRGDYAVTAEWHQEEGLIGLDRFDQLNLYGKLGFSLGEASELLVGTRYSTSAADDYPEASGGPLYGSGEVRSSDMKQFEANLQLLLGKVGHRNYRFFAMLHESQLDRQSPGVPPVVPESVEETNYSRVRLGGSSVLYRDDVLHVSAGADADRESAVNASVLAGAISGDYRRSRTTGGIFGELVAERGPFLLEAGIRVDFPEGYRTEWIPKLGGSFQLPNGTTRFRASYSGGFKLPSFFALASPAALGGNPELAPETSRGVDVGWIQRLGRPGNETRVTLFFNRFENLIDFDFDAFAHVNRAAVSSNGVEWSFDWRAARAWWLATQLTWNKVRDRATDEPLRNRPAWSFGAQVGLRPSTSLTLWLDGRTVSTSLDSQLPIPDRDEVPGYGVLGLSAIYQIAERWAVHARVDNLADADYETFIGFPGPGRGARVSIQYSLDGEGH